MEEGKGRPDEVRGVGMRVSLNRSVSREVGPLVTDENRCWWMSSWLNELSREMLLFDDACLLSDGGRKDRFLHPSPHRVHRHFWIVKACEP